MRHHSAITHDHQFLLPVCDVTANDRLVDTALSSHDSPALRHHVRVEDIAPWNINPQNKDQEPLVILMHIFLRMVEREVHEKAFRGDANGIQDEEGVVPNHVSHCPFPSLQENRERKRELPQPLPPPRHRQPTKLQHEESITNTLRYPPSKHASKERKVTILNFTRNAHQPFTNGLLHKGDIREVFRQNTIVQPRPFAEGVHNAPDNRESRSDLHRCCDHGCADDADEGVKDFETGEGLSYQQQREDLRRDIGDGLEVILLVFLEERECGADGAGCPESKVEQVVQEEVCSCEA